MGSDIAALLREGFGWLAQSNWAQFFGTVAATITAYVALDRWRRDRQRPDPVIEIFEDVLPDWPGWRAAHVTIRNSGPAAVAVTGLSPGRFRLHKIAHRWDVSISDGAGGRILPPEPPTGLPPIHVFNFTVQPKIEKAARIAILIGPGPLQRKAPREVTLHWHWADRATSHRMTQLRF